MPATRALEDFFTEEYALNHLIHTYPKPYVVFMDGIVMGGGMGISRRAATQPAHRHRAHEDGDARDHIGLFPDVGGGWFLARCPGRLGEYLALTGQVHGRRRCAGGRLADAVRAVGATWTALVGQSLARQPRASSALREAVRQARRRRSALAARRDRDRSLLRSCRPSRRIVAALEADGSRVGRARPRPCCASARR